MRSAECGVHTARYTTVVRARRGALTEETQRRVRTRSGATQQRQILCMQAHRTHAHHAHYAHYARQTL